MYHSKLRDGSHVVLDGGNNKTFLHENEYNSSCEEILSIVQPPNMAAVKSVIIFWPLLYVCRIIFHFTVNVYGHHIFVFYLHLS
jgi:hypothetical protein